MALVRSSKANEKYLKYLISKIKTAGDKYGLISLKLTEEYFNFKEDEPVGSGTS